MCLIILVYYLLSKFTCLCFDSTEFEASARQTRTVLSVYASLSVYAAVSVRRSRWVALHYMYIQSNNVFRYDIFFLNLVLNQKRKCSRDVLHRVCVAYFSRFSVAARWASSSERPQWRLRHQHGRRWAATVPTATSTHWRAGAWQFSCDWQVLVSKWYDLQVLRHDDMTSR